MKSFLIWLKMIVDRFVPPLFLLPLLILPFDFITQFFWYIGGLFFLVSIVSIIWKLLKLRSLQAKGDVIAVASLKKKLVRPALATGIFLLAVLFAFLSIKSADAYGIETAKRVQAECAAQGICPETISEWSEPFSSTYAGSETRYGLFGTKYILRYMPRNNRSEFEIEVRHALEDSFSVKGGVNKPLSGSMWGGGMDPRPVPIQ
jgi:hypothetical protein